MFLCDDREIMIPGEILNYEVIRLLGEGGMGQVYLARNKSIHQFVAIKVLHPALSSNPLVRDRFRQEAILLSSLDHPNIVKLFNYVENNQGVFLIMEYVDGMTLEDFIQKKNGLIVEERAYPMMTQILDAFSYAHDHGIVHRDIKPSNIFITRDGNIKVLDFGIANIISDSSKKDMAGSPGYMSPEQISGNKTDIRSDIYSLGVLFHEMLTGRPPYDLNSFTSSQVARLILEQPLPRMKDYYPYISDGMQKLVDKATRKDPSKRFQDCKEIKAAIVKNKRIQSKEKEREEKQQIENRRPGVKPWLIAVTAAIVVLGGVAGIYLLFNRDTKNEFSAYKEVEGVPQGVLAPVEGKNRYILKKRNGKTTALQLISEDGTSIRSVDSLAERFIPSDIEYLYDTHGRISKKCVFGPGHRLLYTLSYRENHREATINIKDSSESKIAALRFSYNPTTGMIEKTLFLDKKGKPVSNRDSIFGLFYTYDRHGRLKNVTFTDSMAKPTSDVNGASQILFEYDNQYGAVKSIPYDVKGKMIKRSAREENKENKKDK